MSGERVLSIRKSVLIVKVASGDHLSNEMKRIDQTLQEWAQLNTSQSMKPEPVNPNWLIFDENGRKSGI